MTKIMEPPPPKHALREVLSDVALTVLLGSQKYVLNKLRRLSKKQRVQTATLEKLAKFIHVIASYPKSLLILEKEGK